MFDNSHLKHFYTDNQVHTLDVYLAELKKYTNNVLFQLSQSIDYNDQIPAQVWIELGRLNAFKVGVPIEYGGLGLDFLGQIATMFELSKISASVGLSYCAQVNLFVDQLLLYGTEKQKNKYLPDIISGSKYAAVAMSEKDAGSDLLSMQLTASKEKNYYILNGQKKWITNGPIADVLLVYAKTSSPTLNVGISVFIVEKEFCGYSASKPFDKFGMRGSATGELYFDNCKLPEENLIGTINQGKNILMSALDRERVFLSAGCAGIMQAALDLAIPYVKQRKQFGKRIGDFQLIQAKIADMYTSLNASKAYLFEGIRLDMIKKLGWKHAASIFLFCAENAVKVTLECLQCLGANGYINDNIAGRLVRDAKLYEIGGGTKEIRKIIIARELLQ